MAVLTSIELGGEGQEEEEERETVALLVVLGEEGVYRHLHIYQGHLVKRSREKKQEREEEEEAISLDVVVLVSTVVPGVDGRTVFVCPTT